MSFIFVDIAETSCDELERPLCEFNGVFFLNTAKGGGVYTYTIIVYV